MLDIRMIVSVEHRTLNLGENWNWYTLMKILSDDPEFWHFCNVVKQSCKTTTTRDGPGCWNCNQNSYAGNVLNGNWTRQKSSFLGPNFCHFWWFFKAPLACSTLKNGKNLGKKPCLTQYSRPLPKPETQLLRTWSITNDN